MHHRHLLSVLIPFFITTLFFYIEAVLHYNIVKKGKDNSVVVVVETINLEMVGMSFVDVADVGDLDVQHELSTNMDNFGRRGDDAGALFHILVIGQGIEYVRYVV